jgi:hypothetical protein
MRHFIVRAVVLASLALGATFAYGFSTGPPASRTGAFSVAGKSAEPACNVCHGSGTGIPLNDPSGSVELLDVPANYQPSTEYAMRVRLAREWNPLPGTPLRWGFQLQAVQASTGDSAGTWRFGVDPAPGTYRLVRGSTSSVWRNRRYLEQTAADIQQGGSSPVEWTVRWTSPPGDSGKIYFFVAANAANGDGLSIGSTDYVFTDVDSTTGGGAVDVPLHPSPLALRNALDAPYPNPMWHCTDLSFTIARPGRVSLAVFDANGRRVRTVLDGFLPAGSHGAAWSGQADDGHMLPNGVYFLRLRAPGDSRNITRKVTLAR